MAKFSELLGHTEGLRSLMPSVGIQQEHQLSDAVFSVSLAANVSPLRSNCCISDSFRNRTFLRVEEKLSNLFQNSCSKSLIILLDFL